LNKLHVLGKAINVLALLSPKLAGNIAVRLFIRPRRIPVRPLAQEYLDRAEQLRVSMHNLVGYRWLAKGKTKYRVLLIHGWESHAGRWVPLVQQLRKKGAEVIAFDGPAAGKSGGKETPFNHYIDCIQQVEREYGRFDAVVGHSLGGGVAVQLCHRLSQNDRPKKAVIMAAFDESNHVFDRYHKMLLLSDGVRKAFDRHIIEMVNRDTDQPLTIQDFSNSASAKTLDHVEALVVHSIDDAVSPYQEGLAILEAWPGAKLASFKTEGHRLQGKEVLKAIVSFLDND